MTTRRKGLRGLTLLSVKILDSQDEQGEEMEVSRVNCQSCPQFCSGWSEFVLLMFLYLRAYHSTQHRCLKNSKGQQHPSGSGACVIIAFWSEASSIDVLVFRFHVFPVECRRPSVEKFNSSHSCRTLHGCTIFVEDLP